MPVSKHAQPPLDALHSHSSHDFHVKHRRHDPVFYISAPVFSTCWWPTFHIRLRPCCAFNLGGLSFAWCLAHPHSC